MSVVAHIMNCARAPITNVCSFRKVSIRCFYPLFLCTVADMRTTAVRLLAIRRRCDVAASVVCTRPSFTRSPANCPRRNRRETDVAIPASRTVEDKTQNDVHLSLSLSIYTSTKFSFRSFSGRSDPPLPFSRHVFSPGPKRRHNFFYSASDL